MYLFSIKNGICLDDSCFDILEYYSTINYSDLPALRWNILPYPAVLGLAIRLNLTNRMFMDMIPGGVFSVLPQFVSVLLLFCHSS